MSLRETVEQLVADFQERSLPRPTPRRVVLHSLPGKVDAVMGMRRSGKTWLLFERIRALEAAGVPRSRILYVNFEDERLLPLGAADLQLFPDALYRRFPSTRLEERWFFFDEIQNVPGWERFIRRMVDEAGTRIALTGSSARLLGREIATSLRGRSLATELLPFGFDEALAHLGVPVPDRWPPPAAMGSLLQHHLRGYLTRGGFPEVQSIQEPTRVRVLQDYLDVVLLRDIIERHGVSNTGALRWLVRRLVGAPCGRFSVNRLYQDLRSQGVSVSKDSLHEWVSHLEDAFLIFPVSIHAWSEQARAVHLRKGYLVDPGLATATSFKAGSDLGHLLENTVYLELRRRGYEVRYVETRSGYEVDFLASSPLGETVLVQVCADISEPPTRERETRALREAMEELSLRESFIVTLEDTDQIELPEGTIHAVPAWRWLLESLPRPLSPSPSLAQQP